MLTQMGEYAEKFGYADKAEEGRGREVNDAFLQTAFGRLGGNFVNQRNQAGADAYTKGMQFSGVNESKTPAALIGQLASGGMQAESQVAQDDEQYKIGYQQRMMTVLGHEDSYAMEQERMKMLEGDWLDTIGRYASLASTVSAFA